MQHQDHFVAEVRQCPAQRRGQDDAPVEGEAAHAVGARRFHFAVGRVPDRAGEDFRHVGAGVEDEGQHRAVEAVAEERVEKVLGAYGIQAVDAGVEEQQLDVQRGAAEHVGVEPDRVAQQRVAAGPRHRQRDGQQEAKRHGEDQQPQGHRQSGQLQAVGPQVGLPVFVEYRVHGSGLLTPSELRRSSHSNAALEIAVMAR